MKRAKRFLSLVLAFALVLGSSSLPSGVVTVNATGDSTTSATLADFTTKSDGSGGIIITGYTGTATALDLPKIFEGQTVTQIDEGAFSQDGVSNGWATGMAPNGNNIVSVIIPKTVTTIQLGAFAHDSALTTVTFEAGSQLKTIYTEAFSYTPITSISIPGTVTSLGASKTSTNGGTKHDDGAFRNCTSLTSVTFEGRTANELTLAADGDFRNCSSLTSIAFPDCVTSIPANECNGASSLSSVTLPANLKSIGSSAFSGTKLSSIVFPDGLETIGSQAFYNCKFTELTFPSSVTTLDKNAFQAQANTNTSILTSVTFEGDTTIADDAFNSINKNAVFYAYYDKATNIKSYCSSESRTFNYLTKEVKVATKPEKVAYTYGDSLESTGLTLNATVLNSDQTTASYTVPATEIGKSQYEYNNKLAGPQEVTVSYGKAEDKFNVAFRYDLSKASVTLSPSSYVYTAAEILPELTVTYDSKTIPAEYYTVSGENNINVGTRTATYTVTANNNNYTIGSKPGTYSITQKPLTDSNIAVTANPESFIYNGEERIPEIVVTHTEGTKVSTLKANTDYTVSYSRTVSVASDKTTTDVGEVTATVTGKGNYKGTITTTYNIDALDIASGDANVEIEDIEDQTYTGSYITPDVTVIRLVGGTPVNLVKGTDYTVGYSANKAIGTATVTITGKGNYTGKLTKDFEIVPIDLASEDVTVADLPNVTYTGEKVVPEVSVKWNDKALKEGTDYTFALSGTAVDASGDAINAGDVKVTITGKGNFTGDVVKNFIIKKTSIEGATVSKIEDQVYTGKVVEPEVLLTFGDKELVKDTDYEVSYSDNTNVGTAGVVITGKGNFTGEQTATFKIRRLLVVSDDDSDDASGDASGNAQSTVTVVTIANIADQTYTGSDLTPAITVAAGDTNLTLGTDYTVTYKNNQDVGTAQVIVTGNGDYTGTLTKTFKILPASIANAAIAPIANVTATGAPLEPDVTVTMNGVELDEGTDYTVIYSNNTAAGTATVIVSGIGNYTGQIQGTFTIVAPVISQAPVIPTTPVAPVPDSTTEEDADEEEDVEEEDEEEPASQKISVKVLKKTFTAKSLKKKAASFSMKASAKGKLSYKKSSGSKKLSISKSGKIIVKKGTKKGTYKIKVKITAAKTSKYKKATLTKTITVTVK